MRRAVLRLVLILAILAGGGALGTASAAGTASATTSAAHNPVIFIHGILGDGWNWSPMIDDFVADGWQRDRLYAWSYDWTASNEVTAGKLAAKVDQVLAETGASKVDILAHSMGSLSSRWYIKFLGGGAKVGHWVSLAGPNHGSVLTPACSWAITSCRDMSTGSDFLTTLNSGDETAGAVSYTTFWSSCDELVIPHSSVLVTGATNVAVGCVEHAWFLFSDPISQQVRATLS
jgi:triacylglycerol lipase